MNIFNYISELLKANQMVSVPYLGIFSLENSPAIIDKDGSINPPTQQIILKYNPDIKELALIHFIASKNKLDSSEILKEIEKKIKEISIKIEKKENIEFSSLGSFHYYKTENDQILYKGEKTFTENSDFFGLESIHLKTTSKNKKNTSLTKIILWIFLIILPFFCILAGIFYFSNHSDISVKTSTHRITEKKIKPIQNQDKEIENTTNTK